MIALKALRAIEDAMKAGAGTMQTERVSTSGTAGVARRVAVALRLWAISTAAAHVGRTAERGSMAPRATKTGVRCSREGQGGTQKQTREAALPRRASTGDGNGRTEEAVRETTQ